MTEPDLQERLAAQRRLLGPLRRAVRALDPGPIELRETHLSWVLLSPGYVLKLKKALRYAYLDHATPAARRRACQTEVRLNRRLAPEVYLGVRAITPAGDGDLALDGPGPAADYLVQMHRLPESGSFERRLQAGTLDGPAVDALAGRLARFYAALPPEPLAARRHLAALDAEIAEDAKTLCRPAYGLERALVRRNAEALQRLLAAQAETIARRVDAGHMVEGHGDLRPEHVWYAPQPVIIDCLEFNRGFRIVDPVDELGFLALECERLGAGWVRPRLLARYAAESGDVPPAALCRLFTARRALLWAKLAVWHLDRDPQRDRDKWTGRAQTYLALARDHLD